jgi:hypothetical protein
MARITCPDCGTVQDNDDRPRGGASECRACGRPLDGPDGVPAPDERPPAPRRKRRRRKRRARPLRDGWRYYTGAIGAFGWSLIALTGLWLGGLALALIWPELGQGLLIAGSALVLVGNVWIAFVAYGDSQVFGFLCFSTCLFSYVYVFMNPDETWRPAALTVLGFLCTFSGLLVSQLAAAAPAA